jgi:hypothetical protein
MTIHDLRKINGEAWSDVLEGGSGGLRVGEGVL